MKDIKHNVSYLTREDKEKYLKQQAKAVWLTGLSGAGKSTIANGLERQLAVSGYFTRVLDGDVIRKGINSDLGFTTEQRYENIRRIAEVNRLFNQTGIITINAFISPTLKIRTLARQIIGKDRFIEVYVNASLQVCIGRDPKGLYKRALAGEIRDFTGMDAPYEAPENPDLVIDTEKLTEEEAVAMVFQYVLERVKY